jgi:3-oxoacyl-(acyl-carrier-protein) synthase III
VNTAILGTGSYLPDPVLTSAELGRRLGCGEDWIVAKTGIRQRRVAAPDEATSDLASRAAQRALDAAGLPAAAIDVLVLATSTPDQPIPPTSCLVQATIGATHAVAFDVDAVCSGFVYALEVARSMLLSDPTRRTALVIGADTYSRVLDYSDRRTCVLFGDGAGAVVLARTGGEEGVLASTLASDGTLAGLVQIPAGGSRRPASAQTLADGGHHFAMRGGDVRRLADVVVPKLLGELLDAAHLDLPEVDLIVPHQPNGRMLLGWEASLHLEPGLLHHTVEQYGNTGAASVPVTLDDAVEHGLVQDGDVVLLLAFGGGMTWGGMALRWAGDAAPTDRLDGAVQR